MNLLFSISLIASALVTSSVFAVEYPDRNDPEMNRVSNVYRETGGKMYVESANNKCRDGFFPGKNYLGEAQYKYCYRDGSSEYETDIGVPCNSGYAQVTAHPYFDSAKCALDVGQNRWIPAEGSCPKDFIVNGLAGQYTHDKLCMNPDNVRRYPISLGEAYAGRLEKSCAKGFYLEGKLSGDDIGHCLKDYRTQEHYSPGIIDACLAVQKMNGPPVGFDAQNPERASQWTISSGQGAGTTAPEIYGEGEVGCVANQSSESIAAFWSHTSGSFNYRNVSDGFTCGFVDVQTGRVTARWSQDNPSTNNVSQRIQNCFAALREKK